MTYYEYIILLLTLITPISSSSTSLNFCSSPVAWHIIGGRSAVLSKWPWQSLFFNYASDGYSTMCGATVLNEKWLLTAAHCVMNATSRSYVNVGVKSLDVAKKTLKISQIIIHPQFNLATVQNDIALLQVAKSIPIGAEVQPTCLIEDDSYLVKNSYSGIVTGFGVSIDASSSVLVIEEPSNFLLESEVPLIDPFKCAKNWKMLSGGAVNINTKKQLCAGSYFHGTASGDSGGPLHVLDGSGNYVQVGITSFGANSLQGIIDQGTYPGVYTRVSPFLPWIKSMIGYQEQQHNSSSNISLFVLVFTIFVLLFSC